MQAFPRTSATAMANTGMLQQCEGKELLHCLTLLLARCGVGAPEPEVLGLIGFLCFTGAEAGRLPPAGSIAQDLYTPATAATHCLPHKSASSLVCVNHFTKPNSAIYCGSVSSCERRVNDIIMLTTSTHSLYTVAKDLLRWHVLIRKFERYEHQECHRTRTVF